MKVYKPINGRPLLLLSLCLALGTAFSYLTVYKNAPASLSFFIFALYAFVSSKKREIFYKRVLTVTLAVSLFFAGFFIFSHNAAALHAQALPEGRVRIEGAVTKTYSQELGQTAVLENVTINGIKSKYKIRLYISGGNFTVGDLIGTDAALNFAYGEGEITPLINGVLYKAGVNAADAESCGVTNDIFLKVKRKISKTLSENLGEQGALAEGILTGDTRLIEEDLLNNFRYGGVAHIFSVSGLHIATLAGLLLLIFRKVKYRRFFKPAVITAILFLFSKVVGFSPSSVRASVMCAVFLFAKSLGGRRDNLNALLLAFIIVTLINPANLWDIGFLLSFSAVFFIIILSYPLNTLFRKLPRKLISPLSVSVSASLGTLPIINDGFGYIPLLSLGLNLIFVPLISLCFTLLAAACFLTALIPPLSFLFILPQLMLKLTAILFGIADLSVFTIKGLYFGISSVFFYLLLVALSDKLNLKPIWRTVLAALFFTAFCITFFYIN